MSLKEKSVSGFAWSLAQNVSIRVCSVSSYFVLAALLAPKSFGIVALANTFIQFTSIFSEQSFATALIQRKEVNELHLSSCYWINCLLGVVLFILAYFLSPVLASFYAIEDLVPVIRTLSAIFIISSFGKIHQAILQRNFEFKMIAKANMIGIMVGSIVGIVMALNGFDIWSLVFQQLITTFLSNVFFIGYGKWMPKLLFSAKHFFEIFNFGYKIIFNNIFIYFNKYADDLIVGFFLGPTQLGYYTFAYKIFNTFNDTFFLTNANVTLPLFSSLQSDKVRFKYVFEKAMKLTCYFAVLVYSFMAFISPDIITLVFGPKWAPSIPLIQLFSLGGLFLFIYWLSDQALICLGQLKASLTLNFSNAGLSIGLVFLLVQYGINTVSFAYLIRAILIMPFIFYLVKRYVGTDAKSFLIKMYRSYIFYAICAICMLSFTSLIEINLVAGIVFKGILMLLLVVGYTYAFDNSIFVLVKEIILKVVNRNNLVLKDAKM